MKEKRIIFILTGIVLVAIVGSLAVKFLLTSRKWDEFKERDVVEEAAVRDEKTDERYFQERKPPGQSSKDVSGKSQKSNEITVAKEKKNPTQPEGSRVSPSLSEKQKGISPTDRDSLYHPRESGDSFAAPVDETQDPNTAEDEIISLSGYVINKQGDPVKNVRIILRGEGRRRNEAMGITDMNGRFDLKDLHRGVVRISAMPPGNSNYVDPPPVTKLLQPGEETEELEFILEEGEYIEGVVLNELKEPVQGARIRAVVSGRSKTSRSDQEGYFKIGGVQSGRAVSILTVSHPDYQAESRERLSVLDGFQTFILKRSNNAILKVMWELDGTPVEYFAYRLQRKQDFQGLYIDAGKGKEMVQSPDGTTYLDGLKSGSWRVEVTVMMPGGNPTDIKGSEEFQLEKGEDQVEVIVGIDEGRRVEGSVVMSGEDKEPVEGAEIKFVIPSAGFGRFPKPGSAFEFPRAISDEYGGFVFEALPPGRYTLQAEKDPLRTPMAVDLFVPYDQDPEPIEIVMSGGGVIFGNVIGKEGDPLKGALVSLSVERVEGDGWGNHSTRTDERGDYRFDNLPAGVHYVWVHGKGDKRDSRNVDLGPGDEIELNFDFSNSVKLSGKILFNGQPADEGLSFHFLGEGDSRSKWTRIKEGGTYEVSVQPGRQILRFSNNADAPSGQVEPFYIPDYPTEQQRDLDFPVVDAEVILSFPKEDQFEPGRLVISPPERMFRYGFFRLKMDQESRHVVRMFTGKYYATFRSYSGEWYGQSELVTLGVGLENVLVLEVKKSTGGVKIGGWSPNQLSNTSFTPLRFDVTSIVESSGDIEVLALFENGRHAVETKSAVLVENGRDISRDIHEGWTGADHWNNSYRLNLVNFQPGARYEVIVEIRCDGGADSTGSVYLSLNQ